MYSSYGERNKAKEYLLPELHGREHISVQLWIEKLEKGMKNFNLLLIMDSVLCSIYCIPGPALGFRAEFYYTSDPQIPFLINSIKESVELFTETFGRKPHIFVPSNNIFHPEFDEIVAEKGVRFLNVSHRMPYPVSGGNLKYRRFITGKKGPLGLRYYTRNCAFEPNDIRYKGIGFTMKQIEAAFRWGKPANISTHRGNFSGGIHPDYRARGLLELKKLLRAIIMKWPDVEFMSSGDALEYMSKTN